MSDASTIKVLLSLVATMSAVVAYFLRQLHLDHKNLDSKLDVVSQRLISAEKDIATQEKIRMLENLNIVKDLGVLERHLTVAFRRIDEIRDTKSGNA